MEWTVIMDILILDGRTNTFLAVQNEDIAIVATTV